MFVLRVDQDVILKLRDKDHAKETFALIQKNRVYLREWLNWVDKVQTIKDSIDNIVLNEEEWEMQTDLHLGIFKGKEMIGMISLHGINYINHNASIGYWIDRSHEGKGIMTACVSKLIEYGFEELKLHRIEIRAGVQNHKSRAIPERLGFSFEGVARAWEFLYDHYIDLAVYSLLKDEYKPFKRKLT
jgi:ribosomal-protein-serine acetyltransferase